ERELVRRRPLRPRRRPRERPRRGDPDLPNHAQGRVAGMPWLPELFSAPVAARVVEGREHETHLELPFFAGVMTGELGALIDSFAASPRFTIPSAGASTERARSPPTSPIRRRGSRRAT